MADEERDRAVASSNAAGGTGRSGVLVLTVWREGERAGDVRCRARACLDIADGRQEISVVQGVGAIERLVADWLARFIASQQPAGPRERGADRG
jgi:hypothetical protein